MYGRPVRLIPYFLEQRHVSLIILPTLQSLCMVFVKALYVSESSCNPSGWSFIKSKSFNVGEDLARSLFDAFRLYVEPWKTTRCRTLCYTVRNITFSSRLDAQNYTQFLLVYIFGRNKFRRLKRCGVILKGRIRSINTINMNLVGHICEMTQDLRLARVVPRIMNNTIA